MGRKIHYKNIRKKRLRCLRRYRSACRKMWLRSCSPYRLLGKRTHGALNRVRFPNDEKTRQLKAKIEETLGTQLQSAKPTQTI